MSNRKVRVRFAPSPTGPLHIGGVRTALFNYLFAKKHGGDFLLRIEDTDQNRYVPGAEEYIIESLKWSGIKIDEGVTVGGPHDPYRQSDRKPIYRQYAEKLVNDGYAYYAFDTPEELEALRKKLEAEKARNTSYSPFSRMGMKNSLTLTAEETKKHLDSGDQFVIRFKMPENETVRAFDIIRDWVEVNTSTLDDKVLFKSDGMPTYHLANVVDDYLMKISHVIRGEEWLPSLPLHVLLYKYLGWEQDMPAFAHLPLLLKPDGKGKLSKRDGDRLGFPVFPLQWTDPVSGEISSGYREAGYLPEAFINMLAFLGWNPGTEQEIFSMSGLSEVFSLEKVGKSGAKFDAEKAKWFNHQYLTETDNNELAAQFLAILKEKGIDTNLEHVVSIVELMKERVNFVKDFWDQASFFFVAPDQYDPEFVKKKWKPETSGILTGLTGKLSEITDFTLENIHECIHSYLESNNLGMGQVMNALRLLIIGENKGPDMASALALIGKDESIRRIVVGIKRING
jgi:glutamyl-tRNA synthetase